MGRLAVGFGLGGLAAQGHGFEAQQGQVIVAGAFGGADADMKRTGEYRGVVLDNIDPVKLAESFSVEAMDATDESKIADAIEHALKTVEDEKRPFLLNVQLPIGLPEGGRPRAPYSFKDDTG